MPCSLTGESNVYDDQYTPILLVGPTMSIIRKSTAMSCAFVSAVFAGDAVDYTVPIGPTNPAIWPPKEMTSVTASPYSDYYGKTGSSVHFY